MRNPLYSPFGVSAALALALTLTPLRSHGDAAKVGSDAPAFSLKGVDGKTVNSADLKDKVVVLEWANPACPFVQRHYEDKTMSTAAARFAGRGVVWLTINSNSDASPEAMKTFAREHGLKHPVLLDPDGTVGKAYGAKATPHMFVINKGKLAYAGAIDNDPDGEKADRVNYVEKALSEVLAGKEVSEPETRSYGCGVKYRREE